MPLFAITMPANAEVIFTVLLQIAAFEMIPVETLYENMIKELAKLNSETLDYLQTRMESLGFDTTWILPNLGSLLLFLGLFPLMVVIYAIETCLARSCAPGLRERQQRMRSFVFWRWPIGFLKDNYIVIAICSMYNLRYASWTIAEARLNSGISLGLLTFLVIYPFAIQAYLYTQRSLLSDQSFRASFGVAYRGLSLQGMNFLYQPLFYFMRRVLVPMSIIYYPKVFILHYSVLVLTGLATIVLLGVQRPFDTRIRNNAQILEESTIIVIMYHIFCFTDWMSDLKVRHAVGYSVTACVLLHLFIFIGFSLGSSARTYIIALRR